MSLPPAARCRIHTGNCVPRFESSQLGLAHCHVLHQTPTVQTKQGAEDRLLRGTSALWPLNRPAAPKAKSGRLLNVNDRTGKRVA